MLEKMRYELGQFPIIDFYGADGEDDADPTETPAGDGDGAGAPLATATDDTTDTPAVDDDYVSKLKKESAAYRKRAQEAEAALKKQAEAELSEMEKLNARLDELSSTATSASAALREERITNAVLRVAHELNFHDATDARGQLHLDDIEFDENGRPDERAIREQLKRVAKAKPYLISNPDFGSGDGGTRGDPVTPDDQFTETRKKYEKQYEQQGFLKIPQR